MPDKMPQALLVDRFDIRESNTDTRKLALQIVAVLELINHFLATQPHGRPALPTNIHPHIALSVDNDATFRSICVGSDMLRRNQDREVVFSAGDLPATNGAEASLRAIGIKGVSHC